MQRKSYKKKWPKQNLGELIAFLDRQHPEGINLSDVSDVTGMSVKALSYIFIHDDMKLSMAEKFYRCYGYELQLLFPMKDYSMYGIVGAPTIIQKRREYPNAGNLQGLVTYMNDSNMSPNALMTKMGKNVSILLRALKKGDIFISTLYEILDELNIDILWNTKKIEKQ